MARASALEAFMDSYRDFDVGNLQTNFYQDKSEQLVKRPVDRYSYALVRAALNVFVQHNFADRLNGLAFDRDGFYDDVKRYVPLVWPEYLEEAQANLSTATIQPLYGLEFRNWRSKENGCLGAWHRMNFHEFQLDVLIQISNRSGRLGAFEGHCFLENCQNKDFTLPQDELDSCHHLGSAHLQIVADEILGSLGISTESVISAIKWQTS